MIDGVKIAPLKVPAQPELPAHRETARTGEKRSAPPFADVLKSSVMKINQLQIDADDMTNRLALGEVEDVSEVSIAVEKAELALRLMVQIRDKLLDAYNQLSRMGA